MVKLNRSREAIRRLILSQAPFSGEENLRIYNKFFSKIPSSFVIPYEKYRLWGKKVLDVGCSYGFYLIHFGAGSVGVEISEKMVNFARAIGLTVVNCDIENSIEVEDKAFEAAWCSNVLEHMVSPHKLLKEIHRKLKPNGLTFLKIPLIPNRVFQGALNMAGRKAGYKASEHLYAFTKDTGEFVVERAGYKVIEANTFCPPSKTLNRILNPLLFRCTPTITIVAEKR